MVRVRTSVSTRARKKKIVKAASGAFGHRSKRYRQAVKTVIKAMSYQYRDRKVRKREFRMLWISRINAACQAAGIQYSRFIDGLNKAKVEIDRKIIADMAINSPAGFKALVETAQAALKN